MSSTKKGTIEVDTQHKIYSVLFASAGDQVASSGSEGMIRRWRADNGKEVGEAIQIEGSCICASALSPDCNWLACGLYVCDASEEAARVRVWNLRTHEQALEIRGHADTVFSVDFSSDGTKLVTGSADKNAFIWNSSSGEQLVGPLQHSSWVIGVRFSPSGDRLATAAVESPPGTKSLRIYDSENGQQLLEIPFRLSIYVSSPLAWSVDGSQLFAASYCEVMLLDASSGSKLSTWSVPGAGGHVSIILSHNEKFVVVVGHHFLSFWDAFTHKKIGTVIQCESAILGMALSPNDECLATGDGHGKVTFWNLREVIPLSYLAISLAFMDFSEAVFASWTQGDLASVEEHLAAELTRPYYHARALAQRSFIRGRSGQWDMALDDAKKSIEAQQSVAGYVAYAIAHNSMGEYDTAMAVFDLVFIDRFQSGKSPLLLVKAIAMFISGKHDIAISRVDGLIGVIDDQSVCFPIRAHMLLLLGGILFSEGDVERAIELLKRAQEAIPFQSNPLLTVISLIFGWDFDKLDLAIRLKLQDCIKPVELLGDLAVRSNNLERATLCFSAALSLHPPNPASILVKRSRVRATLKSWEEALKDADEAVEADPANPWGYETRHTALHALKLYDGALNAFSRMLSLIERSPDEAVRQLGTKYVPSSRSEKAIDVAVRGIHRISPLVLVDVKSGHLCDAPTRTNIFKSEPEFKELLSSMTEELDSKRIQEVVEGYFRYVTLSHVWAGKEPSFQDVNRAGSIWELDLSSPLNAKLRKFSEVVGENGHRWAWSDTCCIDKTISTVLNQSLRMMYKWYEASVATFVILSDVDPESILGALEESVWMTRAWTSQELLSPKVIRFYTRNWTPYLGDSRANHKESPEIMQELANAIGISRETLFSFNPDHLSVRQKLRLASTRNATVEEDVAYSLIGIFKSDIRPEYGEGYAALGHLLEEIVARSGEVTVLDWTGQSSPYNSCLPNTLAVYNRPSLTSPAIDDATLDARVAELRNSLSQSDAKLIYNQVIDLPPARFANRRLRLPCIMFAVTKLSVQTLGQGSPAYRYRARVSGIGDIEFQTSHKLSPREPHKLTFVHPWIRDLCDPLVGFTWGHAADDDDGGGDGEPFGFGPEDHIESSAPSKAPSAAPSPLRSFPPAIMDDYTRALRMVVRLRQPFHALLLQQQLSGELRRVAADYDIVVPGIDHRINFARDVRTEVVEIL